MPLHKAARSMAICMGMSFLLSSLIARVGTAVASKKFTHAVVAHEKKTGGIERDRRKFKNQGSTCSRFAQEKDPEFTVP